jgi:hypothetical protein
MKPTLNKKPEQARLEQTHLAQGSQIGYLLKQNTPALIVVSILIVCVMTAPTFGVSVEALKAPVKALRDDIFGGWMWVAKIGAAVGGCVMAVYQRDIVPMATGAAVGLGIHFYDGYFGDPTAGALI